MDNSNKELEDQIIYRSDCEEEERAKQALAKVEKEKFLNGLKRYPEKGVPVYIDNKEAGPEDWEKLTMFREDNRFYMGDFVQNEIGQLKEIRFDMVYHGEIRSERDNVRRRGAKKKKTTNAQPESGANEKDSNAKNPNENDSNVDVPDEKGLVEMGPDKEVPSEMKQ